MSVDFVAGCGRVYRPHMTHKGKGDTPRAQLLGEGSYGCVFRPEIPCAGRKTPIRKATPAPEDPEAVGKVFAHSDDFRQELKVSKRMARVDPTGSHILTPFGYCKTTRAAVMAHPEGEQCESIVEDGHRGPFYQLSMPYGGSRLDKYVRRHHPAPARMLHTLMPLLETLVMMSKKQTCHQDIKGNNVLRTPEGQAILIDFSLTQPFSSVYAPGNERRLRHTYFPYPPEYRVYSTLVHHANHGGRPADLLADALRAVQKNLHHYGTERAEAFAALHPAAKVEGDVAAMVAWMVGKGRGLKAASLGRRLAHYANRVDVYSTGVMMVDLQRHMNMEGVSQKQKEAWVGFLTALTEPDPRRRATPHRALQMAKDLRKELSG